MELGPVLPLLPCSVVGEKKGFSILGHSSVTSPSLAYGVTAAVLGIQGDVIVRKLESVVY